MHPNTICPICGNANLKEKFKVKDHFLTQEIFSIKICDLCDLSITSPIPENLESYYSSENYISHTNTSKTTINKIYLSVRSYTLKTKYNLIKTLSQSHSHSILDFGCGTGSFLNYFKSKNWETYGVESAEKARKEAQKTMENTIYSTLKEIPKKKFAVVTLWHVLEHLQNPEKILKDFLPYLENNGIILLALPNKNSYDAHRYKPFWAAYDVPRHLWHFSPHAIVKLMNKAGYKLIMKKPMLFDSFYIAWLSENYKRKNLSPIFKLFKAFFIGAFSNTKAVFSKNYSSIIYIFKKNEIAT